MVLGAGVWIEEARLVSLQVGNVDFKVFSEIETGAEASELLSSFLNGSLVSVDGGLKVAKIRGKSLLFLGVLLLQVEVLVVESFLVMNNLLD